MSAIEDLGTNLRGGLEQELRQALGADQVQDAASTDDAFDLGWRGGKRKILACIAVPTTFLAILTSIAFSQLDAVASAGTPEAAEAALTRAYWLVGGVSAIFGLLVVAGALYLARDVLHVAQRMARTMREISNGRTDLVIADRDRTDEFGQMARALEVLRRGTRHLLQLAARDKKAQLRRERQQRKRKEELVQLAQHFDRTVGEVVTRVAAASTQLHATATEMSRAAGQSTERSETVATSMEEAAAGALAAAAASDEFAMSIGEISRQAADSAEIARRARSRAGETDETIGALDAAATEIGQVVEMISTIASRTNLLALNASIEAARGGEAGRGFAVVASEVKELANQTSRATEHVAQRIRAIQESTGNSVSALRTVSAEIAEIESTAIAIAAAVDQQSIAGQDLARSIDRAARNSETVGQHLREVRENALQTGSAANQVLSSASELELQASVLRSQVDDFVAKIRTAEDD